MFEKLKKLFVVDDGKSVQKKTSTPSTAKTNTPPKASKKVKETFQDNIIVDKAISGDINPKFIDKLLKAIEKNNLEGFDYLEFKQTLQNLGKNMLEQTRFESAYAMAKTMNVTVDDLKKSANHYLNILKQEESKFDDALRNQVNLQITQRKEEFNGLEAAIQKKEQQILMLQKEIAAHKSTLKSSNGEVEKAKKKINRTKAEFDLSYNSVINQIREDLKNMDKYIK